MPKPRSTRDLFLKEFPAALADDTAAVFVGAGVSMAAGYPSWKTLLHDIGSELGVSTNDVSDLAALAQWHIRRSSGATKIRQVVRDQLGQDHDVPPSLEILARLPMRHIWTTNYDRLVERAFSAIGRPLDTISAAADISLKPRPGAVRLYKMHGSIDRLEDIVISTEDYELFKQKRGAFLPLLQSHLSSLSLLFVGLSFTDPNVRHVLSLIRETFTDAPPEHFAIVRPPHRGDYRTKAEFEARSVQHDLWSDDLKRYGLRVVEIDSYDEVPELLHQIEQRLALRRVWISGSWPLSGGGDRVEFIQELSLELGQGLGDLGLTYVSGAGTLVGSSALSGFLSSLQRTGSWDLDRRLIVRPFPHALTGREPNKEHWAMLRTEMSRLSGIVIFIGGQKIVNGKLAIADGVLEEWDAAAKNGAFLIPIGASGGAARFLSDRLLDGALYKMKGGMRHPTKAQLRWLSVETKKPADLARYVIDIVKRIANA